MTRHQLLPSLNTPPTGRSPHYNSVKLKFTELPHIRGTDKALDADSGGDEVHQGQYRQ